MQNEPMKLHGSYSTDLANLINAMREQTQAINRVSDMVESLVAVNYELLKLAVDAPFDEDMPGQSLDGKQTPYT